MSARRGSNYGAVLSLIFRHCHLEKLANEFHCRNISSTVVTPGGKLKREWRRKRAPALTKLCLDKPEKYRRRKSFGGGEKTKITRGKEGCYTWKSQDVQFQTAILDVVHNEAHKDFTSRKIMVRGTIIEIDGTPFKSWQNDENVEDRQGQNKPCIDERILEQLDRGKLLAKVSSRPGQEGCIDGYILEGQELREFLQMGKTFES